MKKKTWKRITSMCAAAVVSAGMLIPVLPADAQGEAERLWDFQDSGQNWVYDDSWKGNAKVSGSADWDEEKGMLQVELDFSGDVNNGWSQTGISVSETDGIDFSLYNTLSFDLYYDTSAYTAGQFTIKAVADDVFQEQMQGINDAETEDVDGTLKKASFSFKGDAGYAASERPQKLLLLIVGNNTDYTGSMWFDNICLSYQEIDDGYVDATEGVKVDNTTVTGDTSALTVNGISTGYSTSVKLADPAADEDTVALYQYLKAVGESDAVIFGHMEDTVLKAGDSSLSWSDTQDITGSQAGLDGLDCGNLFDGFAAKYNARFGTNLPETTEGNITAAAYFTNQSLENGAVMTLSSHMPNFAYAEEKEGTSEKTYDRYDYLAADSYNLTGDCMNQILPGGAYHDRFAAYLDMIAEYAHQVNGPVLFRPFHENTGSWFWWGKAFCDPETYKSVFKYTVEYLRDEKDVHNLLYVYGPGSEAASIAEYEERYPGDAYVDMVGFDSYDSNPVSDEEGYTFGTNFANTVRLTDEFAKKHGKLFGVTETGISGLPNLECGRPDWFTEIMDIITEEGIDCSYFMVWTNYSATSYYIPFVTSISEDGTLHGHEMLDGFIRFYNDERSIFASDQKRVLTDGGSRPISPKIEKWTEAGGYITAPVAGTRILEETEVSARLNAENIQNVQIRACAGEKEIPLETVVEGKTAQATLTADTLAQLGETVEGRLALYVGDEKLQEISVIFNVAEAQRDPLCVDDFETYYGSSELLNSTWAVNKDSGCELNLSLTEDPVYDGEYALKFEYNESKTGWAGATVSYEADWSSCNALQFWLVPDGRNQKTVVQINTSDGGSYEAYLNEYEEYASSEKPLLVTMPFSEFTDKSGRGALTSNAAAKISGFGLWVNAISDSEAINADGRVSGTLYYDAIRAVDAESDKPLFEDPDKQVQPEDPDKPAGPGTSEDPDQPKNPDQTKNPDAVKQPSENVDQKTGADSQVTAVQTGDNSGEWVYMAVSGFPLFSARQQVFIEKNEVN